MGASVSRRSEPEVHVVVVQSKENGQVDAHLVRNTYSKSDSGEPAIAYIPVVVG